MKGLTTIQAKKELDKYGLNVIKEQQKKNILIKFFEQFNNFLIILLLLAAILSFIIGETIDGILIATIVLLNAIFGLYQEAKAEEAVAVLKKMTITKIRVIRDGQEKEIDSRYLVPGDMILIEEGVKIPADAKIIQTIHLEINESVLTGESLPVIKKENDEIWMGTVVSKGRGLAQINQTGMATKFGQIANNLSLIIDAKTPLQKKLESLARMIGVVGIILSILVFVLSVIQGVNYFPSFLLAISLAVAVVPEGLPAVMTITLSIGVKEMSKKKAIIKKLSAIEALGSITLIATDKTGTLTTNKMQVKEIFADDKVYSEDNPPNLANRPFAEMMIDGILCSTASLVYVHDHGSFDVLGDPTEGALLLLAQKIGLISDMIRREWQIVDEVPFDSVTKRMSVMVKTKKDQKVFSKGAPESILEICDKILIGHKAEKLTPGKVKKIELVLNKWARKGYRVLAFAYKHNIDSTNLTDLTFLGMVAIHDPPRLEVMEALKKTREAGIKVVMITGDNEKTAEAIGVSTGLINEGDEIMTGSQVEKYSDEELLQILPKTKIFARTTPFHKYRIVKLYQELGEIVAVTGDGVNDSIALKQADVGVAMGLVGTDVARETADMIITDDNFATIVNAVEEGRNIIKNLKNAIKYLLSCNISEALSLIIGLMLGFPNLFYAIQLLYINLITDGVPALALAFSPREENIMKKNPERKLALLENKEQLYIILVGVLSTLIVIFSFYIFRDGDILQGRTAAFTVLALIQSFIFMDLWLSHYSIIKNVKKLLSTFFVMAFLTPFITQLFIIKISLLSNIFRVKTIDISQYAFLIFMASMILIGIRGVKRAIK